MKLQTYSTVNKNESGDYIEGFLIGTKQTKNGWWVDKQSLPQVVNGFVNTDFIIIPEKIAHNIDAHYHGNTKEDTIKGYKDYSHGKLQKVLGPFSYDDGTDDFYYKHITKLSNSKAASILNEYGSATNLPFSISPHIWQDDLEANDHVIKFTPIGVALVHEGAFGEIAVINKMCNGSQNACHKSLGAANKHCNCCQNTDENIAKIVSSQLSKSASNNKLSTNLSSGADTGNSGAGNLTNNTNPTSNTTVNPQNTLTSEPQKDSNQIVLTKEQYDAMIKQVKDSENTKNQLQSLTNERNIEKVNAIFTPYVTDENVRNSLVEKYKGNAEILKGFWADINKNVIPSIIESAKAEFQKEAKTNSSDNSNSNDNNKSKGAANKTLRPEPKDNNNQNEDASKTAATTKTEQQNVNEVLLLHSYLYGDSN